MGRSHLVGLLFGMMSTACLAAGARAMSITGDQEVCPGGIVNYEATVSNCGSSYTLQWTLTPSSAGSVNSSGTTATVFWASSFSGTATISAIARKDADNSQCDDGSLDIQSRNFDKPAFTLAPTYAPCGTVTALTFTVQSQQNVDDLEWNVPSGWSAPPTGSATTVVIHTNTTTAGYVSVTARNTNCPGLQITSDQVFVSRTPAPGSISGPSTIQRKNIGHYSIAAISGATNYTWTVSGNGGPSITGGQGTTDSDVSFPLEGNVTLCVKATNACGTGPATCTAITVVCTPPPITTCPAPVWVGGYGTNDGWGDPDATPRFLADLNGDGLSDVVGISFSGVDVSLSTGSSFTPASIWTTAFSPPNGWVSQTDTPRMLGDVNGDHRDDLVGFSPSSGTWVALSTGSGFGAATQWQTGFDAARGWGSLDDNPRYLSDVDQDGKADLVGFSNDGGVVVALSTGSGFGSAIQWSSGFDHTNGWVHQDDTPRYLADVNGDGWPDIVGFSYDGVDVALDQHSASVSLHAFGAASVYHIGFTAAEGWSSNSVYPRFVIDVNNDQRADIVGFGGDGVSVSLASLTGALGAPQEWVRAMGTSQGWSSQNSYPRTVGSFNCDPYPDLVGFGSSGVLVSLNQNGTAFSCPATLSIGFDHDHGWSTQSQYPRFLATVRPNTHADIVGFSASGVAVEACGSSCSVGPPGPATSPASRAAMLALLAFTGGVVIVRRRRALEGAAIVGDGGSDPNS